MIEAADISETSVYFETTFLIPDDGGSTYL
jgi:hypothetical protein